MPNNSRGAQGARCFRFPYGRGAAEPTALDACALVEPAKRAPAGGASGQSPLRPDCPAAILARARGHPAPVVGTAAPSQEWKLEVSEAQQGHSTHAGFPAPRAREGHASWKSPGPAPTPAPRPHHDGTGPGELRALLGLRPELPHTPARNLGSKGGVPGIPCKSPTHPRGYNRWPGLTQQRTAGPRRKGPRPAPRHAAEAGPGQAMTRLTRRFLGSPGTVHRSHAAAHSLHPMTVSPPGEATCAEGPARGVQPLPAGPPSAPCERLQ